MTKRRRILHTDKVIRNVMNLFCLLMFLQINGYYSEVTNPILLYSTASDIRMVNVSKPNKVNTIVKDLEQGSAVDFLYRKNFICWSDQTAELIQCTHYNETHVGDKIRIVSDDLITPTGIAIDWYTNKIYWTDGETNKIEVISIEEKHRKVLFWSDVDLARAIAVVPKEGLLFWTDWGEVPKIERASMNGDPSTRKIIVKDNIFWPNGITIDYDNNLIYWVDAQLHFVDAIDFNGENRRRVVKTGLVYPYAITIINEKLYWTDWKTWAIHLWDISTNGPKVKELITSKSVPVDIKAYDASRQLLPDDYPCKQNNGGCSHLCLLSSKEPGYSCACPTGVKLRDGSNTTCLNGPQSMLIIAQRATISKISLDSPDFTPYAIPLKDLKRAQSVDFDPKSEYIYWTDNSAKTISRARLDGSDQSVLVHSSGLPDGIAVDPLARNLYWTDPVADTINVARLDGSHKKIVIHEELYEPRALALHPVAGWMFWSDWSERRPRIERACLDGSQRTPLVSERLAWPNGIALDVDAAKLYWGDARTHKIEVIDLDGSNRKELHSSEIIHIFGLTLLGDYLYWTDMQKRTLDRINKDTGGDRQGLVEQMANMMGVKAIVSGATLPSNRCSGNNGGCSHLCFNTPTARVCACPLGLELDESGLQCSAPAAYLVFARKDSIARISLRGSNHDTLPIKDLKEVSAVSVDVTSGMVYWADTKTRSINRCSLDTYLVERLLENLGLVEGLAIDWSSENMYWTDSGSQRIEVARLDGSSRRALLWGLKRPRGLVLHAERGVMYWSELGSRTIKRANMDGTAVATVAEGAGRVYALALDAAGSTLYWAALEPPVLGAVATDGAGRRVIASDLTMPYAVAVWDGRVYWGDWNTGVIESCKPDGTDRRQMVRGADYITSLSVARRTPERAACEPDNGGCSHVCVPTRPARRCLCPQHYTSTDNLTCHEPEDYVLFGQKNAVGRIMNTGGECPDATLPITGIKNLRALDYDPVDKQLYWIEEDSLTIRRVPVSSSSTSATTESTAVMTAPSRPAHLALDVLGRMLYWTGWDDVINVTSLHNASVTGTVVRGEGMMPRQLVFHQTKRLLIWNDVGLGAIMRSNVDGTERSELARAHNASALTLDVAAGVVYWAVNRQIFAADLDGGNKRVLWQGGWSWSLGASGGAVVSCGARGACVRVPGARRPPAPAAPLHHVQRVTALVSVSPVPGSHPCRGGGGCGAASCGAGGRCSCGLRCAPPPACPRSQHRCAGDDVCIPALWRCDGQRDCADGSDEVGCGACAGGLRCVDGSCAAALSDCSAGATCSAALSHAFRCDGRLCLSSSLLCDGTAHCEDGSDEAPPACVYTQPLPETGSGRGGLAAVCGGVACALCALCAAAAVLRRRRPSPPLPPAAIPLCATKHDPPPRTESSSATDSGRYPRPTVNPPPSPATASSNEGGGERRRGYRHYRAINRPPPPTPASTDACESEPEARAPPPSPAP